MPSISKTLMATLAIGAVQCAPARRADSNDGVLATLITTPTEVERLSKLLTKDGQELLPAADIAKATIVDFNVVNNEIPGSNGGYVTEASIETLPILYKSGLNTKFGSVGPCGVLLPHVHPRANEFFIALEGTILTGFTNEAGFLSPNPVVNNTLTKYQGQLFPQGSIHYQQNPTCDNATAVATLNNDDPGTTPYLQAVAPANSTEMQKREELFARGSVSSLDAEWDNIKAYLPYYIVDVAEECRAKCGLAA